MKAQLATYRQSPRKVRLVANLVKGKSVKNALTDLSFLPKRAATPIAKLISSAAANARQKESVSPDALVVKSITVTKGPTLKRIMPAWRGMAHRINKRTSHVIVELGEKKK
jgi:large subunit ribosomal protein L22